MTFRFLVVALTIISVHFVIHLFYQSAESSMFQAYSILIQRIMFLVVFKLICFRRLCIHFSHTQLFLFLHKAPSLLQPVLSLRYCDTLLLYLMFIEDVAQQVAVCKLYLLNVKDQDI